ncbi:unnamed protein product, partial [Rotaria sp. Silwood1]
MGMGLPNYP